MELKKINLVGFEFLGRGYARQRSKIKIIKTSSPPPG
jgi:hypothetical protein